MIATLFGEGAIPPHTLVSKMSRVTFASVQFEAVSVPARLVIPLQIKAPTRPQRSLEITSHLGYIVEPYSMTDGLFDS